MIRPSLRACCVMFSSLLMFGCGDLPPAPMDAGADLTGADMTGADMAGADMRMADMANNPGCSVCDTNATCGMTGGTVTCTCNNGFTGDGMSCTACTVCGGSQLETAACTATTDTVCGPCTVCGAGTYESAACAPPVDTVCSACESNCNTCTGAGPGDCTACAANFYLDSGACSACTVCGYGQYASTACGASADTVCSACEAGCDVCTAAGPGACTLCSAGYVSDGSGGCMAFGGLSLRIRGIQTGTFEYLARSGGNSQKKRSGISFATAEGTCTGTGCDIASPTFGDHGSVRIRPPADGTRVNWTGCSNVDRKNECYVNSLPAAIIAEVVPATVTLTVQPGDPITFEYFANDRTGRGIITHVQGTCDATCTFTAQAGVTGVRIRGKDRGVGSTGRLTFTGCDRETQDQGVRHFGNECEVRSFPAQVTAEYHQTGSVTINNAGDPNVVFEYFQRSSNKTGGPVGAPIGTCTGATCNFTTAIGAKGLWIRARGKVNDWNGCNRVTGFNYCEVETFPATIDADVEVVQVDLTVTGDTSGTFLYMPRRRAPIEGSCSGASCTFFPGTNRSDTNGIRILPSSAGPTVWTGCDQIKKGQCYVQTFPASITAAVTTGPMVTLNVAGVTNGQFEYVGRPHNGSHRDGGPAQGTCTGATCVFNAPQGSKGFRIRPPIDKLVTWDSGCDQVQNGQCYLTAGAGPFTIDATVSDSSDITLTIDGVQTGTFGYMDRIKRSISGGLLGTCTGAGCAIPGRGDRGVRIFPPADLNVAWSGCSRVSRQNICYANGGDAITATASVP